MNAPLRYWWIPTNPSVGSESQNLTFPSKCFFQRMTLGASLPDARCCCSSRPWRRFLFGRILPPEITSRFHGSLFLLFSPSHLAAGSNLHGSCLLSVSWGRSLFLGPYKNIPVPKGNHFENCFIRQLISRFYIRHRDICGNVRYYCTVYTSAGFDVRWKKCSILSRAYHFNVETSNRSV
jgi:hypothetical protein